MQKKFYRYLENHEYDKARVVFERFDPEAAVSILTKNSYQLIKAIVATASHSEAIYYFRHAAEKGIKIKDLLTHNEYEVFTLANKNNHKNIEMYLLCEAIENNIQSNDLKPHINATFAWRTLHDLVSSRLDKQVIKGCFEKLKKMGFDIPYLLVNGIPSIIKLCYIRSDYLFDKIYSKWAEIKGSNNIEVRIDIYKYAFYQAITFNNKDLFNRAVYDLANEGANIKDIIEAQNYYAFELAIRFSDTKMNMPNLVFNLAKNANVDIAQMFKSFDLYKIMTENVCHREIIANGYIESVKELKLNIDLLDMYKKSIRFTCGYPEMLPFAKNMLDALNNANINVSRELMLALDDAIKKHDYKTQDWLKKVIDSVNLYFSNIRPIIDMKDVDCHIGRLPIEVKCRILEFAYSEFTWRQNVVIEQPSDPYKIDYTLFFNS
ncbi:MAG: hypothetical protein J0G32_07030 [Alphaproteobacteria bacterium]|nr:hypothetical protein [Alphaproteobacteria bacterium]